MKALFVDSAKILNTNIFLVLLVGICQIRIISGLMAYISLIGLTVSFVLGIVVYGRIVAQIQREGILPAFEIVKSNWFNYLIVVILISFPFVLYGQLSKAFSMSIESYIFLQEGVRTLLNILSIYILPIVFIKKQHILSILAGIVYLFNNFAKSMPIITLLAVVFIVNSAVSLWIAEQTIQEKDILSYLPLLLLVNISMTYASFLVFTAASVVLIPRRL